MKNIKAYFKPATVKEAVELLKNHPGKGAFIAGGTNIVVEKNPELDYVVDVHLLGLDSLTEDECSIRIGACTTIETLYHSTLANTLANGLFAQVASWFASKQIRNVATLGGNIAKGLSAADMIPPLLAMDAHIIVSDGETERGVPIQEFIRPIANRSQELIVACVIPKIYQQATGKFLKQSKTREDISIVSVTTVLMREGERCRNVRIALGAVAQTAIRIPEAESVLEGKMPTQERIEQTAKTVIEQIHPIDNFRASAQFRKEISYIYTKRTLEELLSSL